MSKISDFYGHCLRCDAWFMGPDDGCPRCDKDTSNMLLPHAPFQTCMAMDCPLCCGMEVDEEDLPAARPDLFCRKCKEQLREFSGRWCPRCDPHRVEGAPPHVAIRMGQATSLLQDVYVLLDYPQPDETDRWKLQEAIKRWLEEGGYSVE